MVKHDTIAGICRWYSREQYCIGAHTPGSRTLNFACVYMRAAAMEIGRLRAALQAVAMNDRTHYEHHEPRACDGAAVSDEHATRWCTPREIAEDALR